MGVKSKVRSMQRGASKRNNSWKPNGSVYNKDGPTMDKVDEVHLGLNEEAKHRIYRKVQHYILTLKKSDFRKPSEVSRLLNKQGLTTCIGEKWTPRLAHFLLRGFFEWNKVQPTLVTRIPTSSSPMPNKSNNNSRLTIEENIKRQLAYKKFLLEEAKRLSRDP